MPSNTSLITELLAARTTNTCLMNMNALHRALTLCSTSTKLMNVSGQFTMTKALYLFYFPVELNGDEDYLKYLVATYGPIIVVIWVNDPFVQYKSGVYYETDCPNDMESFNHAIGEDFSIPCMHQCLTFSPSTPVVVGYGTDNSTTPPMDYWLIRNRQVNIIQRIKFKLQHLFHYSWSERWGIKGGTHN
jgi:hypothetical protein